MKLKTLYTFIFLLSIVLIRAQTTKKVLFIGNSYTYYSDMPNIIKQLASSNGDTLIYDQNTPGGSKLTEHAVDTTSIKKILDYEWDNIVLQDYSLNAAYRYSEFNSGINQMISIINKTHTEDQCHNQVIFYMTWGRENDINYPYYEHQERTTIAYNTMAGIYDTEVAPVGIAWKKIRDDNDPIHLYDPDGTHPSYAGSYLAACVFYTTLFKKSPIGLPFIGYLDPITAKYIQIKAFEAYHENKIIDLPLTNVSNSKPLHITTNLSNTQIYIESNYPIQELTILNNKEISLISKQKLSLNDTISISNLKNGLYFIKVRTKNTFFVKKLFINK